MPKKFEKNWPLTKDYDEETGRILICTLGNMAMLPQKLNSSISNANWETKKRGKKNSNGLSYYASDLVTLKNVVACKEWSEETIIDRADWLGKIANEIWPSYEILTDDDDFDIEEKSKLEVVSIPKKKQQSEKTTSRDNTKYSFDGKVFLSKSEFVVTLVRKYMEKNPELAYVQLKQKFHDGLCAKGYKFIGFLCTEIDYENWNNKYKEKRYKPNAENRRLVSADGVVFFVNTQWEIDAMHRLVELAKVEGFEIYTSKKKKVKLK